MNENDETLIARSIRREKISCYTDIAWFMVVVFLFVGFFTKKHDTAIAGLIILSCMWVLSNITNRAKESYFVLLPGLRLLEASLKKPKTPDVPSDKQG